MAGTEDSERVNRGIKPGGAFVRTFTRSQVTAASASLVDFGLLFFLTEVVGLWYVASVACGAAAGATTNFLLNRHWTFNAAHDRWHDQAFRYFAVSSGSLLLNTGGTWAVTEWGQLPYGFSVFIVSFVVGLSFNYPLQRYFVFKASR